jgi:formylglycine-generating enzyme required for sulfatase activity
LMDSDQAASPSSSDPPLRAELGGQWERPMDSMTMVYVPEGVFPMGSEAGYDEEKPVHDVSLDAFWIDRLEVTNSQFAQFVEATGYETTAESEGFSFVLSGGELKEVEGANWQHPQGPGSDLNGLADHPVIHMTWHDAEAYCEWVGARLPTEAEWEYAARGPEGLTYTWGDDFEGQKTNYCDVNCPISVADTTVDDGYEFTAPVGNYPGGESWVGAGDMNGNVFEWVSDWFNEDYYASSVDRNPQGPDSGDYKVLRGGAWISEKFNVRSAIRGAVNPVETRDYVGFRCVVSPGI